MQLQCAFRNSKQRKVHLDKYKSLEVAKAKRQITQAKQSFGNEGWMPFVRCVFEKRKFQALMAGRSIFHRVPGDPLHLVRSNCSFDMYSMGIVLVSRAYCMHIECVHSRRLLSCDLVM